MYQYLEESWMAWVKEDLKEGSLYKGNYLQFQQRKERLARERKREQMEKKWSHK